MTAKQEYTEFLNNSFGCKSINRPLFYNFDIGLRFELSIGDSDKEEFFTQAVERAVSLFEASFHETDEIYLLVYEFRYIRNRIKLSNYIFKQITDLKRSEVVFGTIKQLYYQGIGNDIWNQAVLKIPLSRVNYVNLLSAISNIDFPDRKPQLKNTKNPSTEIFFLNIDKKLIFNMYDDRGLDIVSNRIDTIRPIYEKYEDWIIDYDKEAIEKKMKI